MLTEKTFERIVNDLAPLYSEPLRVYHNFEHIDEMFAIAGKNKLNLSDAQTLAILFHDVVYVPTSFGEGLLHGSLERLSATYLINYVNRKNLLDEIEVLDLQHALSMILATIHHKIDVELKESHPMLYQEMAEVLDLDLFRLAGSYEDFLKFGDQVAQEYSSMTDNDAEVFKAGRCKFFTEFMNRDKIYLTEQFQNLYEAEALSNINRYLKENSNAI